MGRQRLRRARTAALGALVALALVPSSGSLRVVPTKVVGEPEVAAPARALVRERLTTPRGGDPAAAAAPAPGASTPAPAPAAFEAAIAPPPATFDAPPAPAAPPPALLKAAATPAGGVWAVVIGIDDYPGYRSDLRASVADANVVDWTLAKYGVPADRRLVLRNTQASAAVIEESLRWLVSHAGPDATALFFYAGHVRKLASTVEAIVAADGRLVRDSRVAELLAPLQARSTWVVMASCYGGGFNEVLGTAEVILTGAASSRELAYENATYGNSYLVEYLFERAMLQGYAPETVERSFAWALEALRRDHPNRVPVQYDQLTGELRIGTPPPPTRPAPTSEPSPAEPPPSPPPSSPSDDEDDPDGDCLITIPGIAGCD